MQIYLKLILVTLLAGILPAHAHLGTDVVHQHFFEHILIALMIGIPLVVGLVIVTRRHHKSDS